MADEDYVRVRDKDTGHEYSIMRRSVDRDAHELTQKKAVDDGGSPLPPVHNLAVGQPEPVQPDPTPKTSEAQK